MEDDEKILIGYFLEDRLQEGFIKSLVEKIASDEGFSKDKLENDIRSSTGGGSIRAFREFLKSQKKARCRRLFDVLVVAIDGNCKGHGERLAQLRGYADKLKYPAPETIAFAIPDPHIERWYLIDREAFARATASGVHPDMLSYKCKKDYYKQAMRDSFRKANMSPPLGGYEYAEKIVNEMSLYRAGRDDVGLSHFVDNLSGILRLARQIRTRRAQS